MADALFPAIAARLEAELGPRWAERVDLGHTHADRGVFDSSDPYYVLWLAREWRAKLFPVATDASRAARVAVDRLFAARNDLVHPKSDSPVSPSRAAQVAADALAVLERFGALTKDAEVALKRSARDAELLKLGEGTGALRERREALMRRVRSEPEVDLSWLAGHRALRADMSFVQPSLRPLEVGTPATWTKQTSGPDHLIHGPGLRHVIVGPAGAGKSTLIRHIAQTAARDPQTRWTPVVRKASALAARLADDTGIADVMRSPQDRDHDLIAYDLEANRLFLLVDGLDEVSPFRAQRKVMQALLQFCADFPAVRVIVATRDVGHAPGSWGPLFEEHMLLPIDKAARRRIIAGVFASIGGPAEDGRDVETLLSEIEARADVAELTATPLQLTLAVAVWIRRHQLPDRRVELYEEVVDLLLDTWPARREFPLDRRIDRRGWRRALEMLADAMIDAGDRLDEASATRVLRRWLAGGGVVDGRDLEEEASEYLEIARLHLGMLLEAPQQPGGETEYLFRIRSIAEYLAACELVRESRQDSHAVLQRLHRSNWARVIEDYFGILSDDQDALERSVRILLAETDARERLLLGNLRLLLSMIRRRLFVVGDRLADELAILAASRFAGAAHDAYAHELLGGFAALVQAYPERAYNWPPAEDRGPRSQLLRLIAGGSEDAAPLRVLLGISRREFGDATRAASEAVFGVLGHEPFWQWQYRPHRILSKDSDQLRYLCGCGGAHELSDAILARLRDLALETITARVAVADPDALSDRLPCLMDTTDAAEIHWQTAVARLAKVPAACNVLPELKWFWWRPMLRHAADLGAGVPGWLADIIEDLDDDSDLVGEYVRLLARGSRRLQRHAARMLDFSACQRRTVGGGWSRDRPFQHPPAARRVACLLDWCMTHSDEYARLLLATKTIGSSSFWGPDDDWVVERLERYASDASEAVRSAIAQLRAQDVEEMYNPPFMELDEWWSLPDWRITVADDLAVPILIREAVMIAAPEDAPAMMRRAVERYPGRPPQVRGRTGLWRQHAAAEVVARDWAASTGPERAWGLYVLGKLVRTTDASALLGPALAASDVTISRLAASAIQPADCRRGEWLHSPLEEHILRGADDPTLANLAWTVPFSLVERETRRSVGELAAVALDLQPSRGARELAEAMLLSDGLEAAD